MHFKRLELYGFKSFADKTTLEFEPGITAIVGPNGCGKSNVADAIKWVLGEQSARELRGLKMEDVIFNGTSLKEPVNFAEVSLVLSNEAKILPIEYEEITITRRLFRSGESEYLLNRTPVRLRDIQELFMGTGIGISAYSLLEQGKIDLILSSKAEDRRLVFEEAAGITKFKSQKRETLRRLQDTENNLLRVNDIIVEVKRQISSIERQANKAERYKEVFNLAREKELKINKYLFIQLKNQIKELEIERNLLKTHQEKLSCEFNDGDSKINNKRKDLDLLEQEISNFQNDEVNLKSEFEKNQSKAGLNKERIEELESRIKDLIKEGAELTEKIATDSKELFHLSSQYIDCLKSEESKKLILEEKQKFLGLIDRQINEKEELISGLKLKLINIFQDISARKNELTKIKTENTSLFARLRRLESEKEKTLREKFRFSEIFEQAKKTLDTKKEELKALSGQIEAKNKDKTALNEKLATLIDSFHKLDVKSQTLNSRIEFLEELKTRYEGYSPGVKSLLLAKASGQLNLDGLFNVLADVIDVDKGYEQAFQAALNNYAQAIILKDYETLNACLSYADKVKLGELSFIVSKDLEKNMPSVQPEGSRNIVYLKNFVHCPPQYMPIIEFLLGNFVLVDSIASGLYMCEQHKNHPLKFITVKGEIIERNIVKTASYSSDDDLNIIGRDRRIKELKDAYLSLDADKNNALDGKDSISAELDRLNHELKLIEEQRGVLQVEIGSLEQEAGNLNKNLNKLTDELAVLELEISELNEEMRDNTAKMKENEEALSKLQIKETETNSSIEESSSFASDKINLKQATLIEIAELETELKSFADRVSIFKERISSLDNSIMEAKQRLAARDNEKLDAAEKIKKLYQEISSLETLNVSFAENKSSITVKLTELRTQKSDLKLQIDDEQTRLKEMQDNLDKLKTNVHELEIKYQEINFNIKDIVDKMNLSYKVNLETEDVDLTIELFDCDTVNRELTSLKEKLDSMGPVNLVAIDEHRDLQERYTFLLSQQEDLNKAKDSLHEAINKINRTAKELFTETFQKIEVCFKEIFRLLFGGGSAQLLLIESSDVLESGIEIVAQPPGKKLQNISLLSGGEKALTAVALLFAIFKIRPSPFCILDEVDAPLDESNIDRFRMLMKEFTKASQFIVITHNKRTITVADVMYGITMEESGISKIVSVKFTESTEDLKVKQQAA